MDNNLDKIIDISIYLSKDTIIYPGDPVPQYKLLFSLENQEIANVGALDHGLHHGTHVDVPYHFSEDGKKFEQIPFYYWVGPALVVDATKEEECIFADTLKDVALEKYKRILFKTKNSTRYYKYPGFYEKFIYLDKSACELFVKNKVLTVGLDYITVDHFGCSDFPAHKTLLLNEVCIIESINLEGVEAGEYYLMCLPLKLKGTDGANARALLLKQGFCV